MMHIKGVFTYGIFGCVQTGVYKPNSTGFWALSLIDMQTEGGEKIKWIDQLQDFVA